MMSDYCSKLRQGVVFGSMLETEEVVLGVFDVRSSLESLCSI